MTTEQSRIKPALDAVATAAEAMAGEEYGPTLSDEAATRLATYADWLEAPDDEGNPYEGRDEKPGDIHDALAELQYHRARSDQWLAFATRIRAIVNQDLPIVDTKPALDFTLPGKAYPGETGGGA